MSRFILLPGGTLPVRATSGAAAYDCFVRMAEDIETPTGYMRRYRLGFSVDLNEEHCGLLLPRSSVYKTGLRLANSVGLIDSDYHDEVCAVFDGSASMVGYAPGDRCCQFLLMPRLLMVNDNRLPVQRIGGFGSTDGV